MPEHDAALEADGDVTGVDMPTNTPGPEFAVERLEDVGAGHGRAIQAACHALFETQPQLQRPGWPCHTTGGH